MATITDEEHNLVDQLLDLPNWTFEETETNWILRGPEMEFGASNMERILLAQIAGQGGWRMTEQSPNTVLTKER